MLHAFEYLYSEYVLVYSVLYVFKYPYFEYVNIYIHTLYVCRFLSQIKILQNKPTQCMNLTIKPLVQYISILPLVPAIRQCLLEIEWRLLIPIALINRP